MKKYIAIAMMVVRFSNLHSMNEDNYKINCVLVAIANRTNKDFNLTNKNNGSVCLIKGSPNSEMLVTNVDSKIELDKCATELGCSVQFEGHLNLMPVGDLAQKESGYQLTISQLFNLIGYRTDQVMVILKGSDVCQQELTSRALNNPDKFSYFPKIQVLLILAGNNLEHSFISIDKET